jgi:hypothetical protein
MGETVRTVQHAVNEQADNDSLSLPPVIRSLQPRRTTKPVGRVLDAP